MKTLHLAIITILTINIFATMYIPSVFAENNTLKLGPPASNMSIQEVNAGENSQWSSLPIFGAIGGVIVVTILAYVIKTRKRKTIK